MKNNSCPDCDCDQTENTELQSDSNAVSPLQPKNNLLVENQKLTYYKICLSNTDIDQEDIIVFHDLKSAEKYCSKLQRYVSYEIIKVTEKVIKVTRSVKAHYLG